jgi:prepilin-type N-terminal cleavage/methylation domain-containing protein
MKMVRDNKGMSLVEVIVAITILSLVVVPVLQAMTTATIYNAKARVRQDLTLTAESIMETFKGYDLESLVDMFNDKDKNVAGINDDDSTRYNAPTLDDIEDHNKELEFTIENIKQNNKNYTATITLTPNGENEVFEIKNVDSSKDAVFEGTNTYDSNLYSNIYSNAYMESDYEEFYSGFISKPVDKEGKSLGTKFMVADESNNAKTITSAEEAKSLDVSSYIEVDSRELIFEIVKDDEGKYNVNASITYRYYIKDFPFYTPSTVSQKHDSYYGEGETETAEDNQTAYIGELHYVTYPTNGDDYFTYTVKFDGFSDSYKFFTGEELEQLYIYYYPEYDVPEGKDIIVINNTANVADVNCYIIKQKNNDISDTRVTLYEQKYKPTVKCTNSAENFILYHNFDTNIGDSEDGSTTSFTIPEGFTSGKGGNITTSSDLFKKEVISYTIEIDISYNGSSVTNLKSTKNESIKDIEGKADDDT